MIASSKLLPTAELRRLVSGSYEQRIDQAARAVRKYFEGRSIEIVSTHADAVVVLDGDQFLKVTLESDAGSARVVETTPIKVEVIDDTTGRNFLRREAAEIAGLFLSGSVKGAQDRIEGLVPLLARTVRPAQTDALEAVSEALQRDRVWRSLFESRKDYFHRFLLGEMDALNESRLHPQFQRLYDGTIEECDCARERDLVNERLSVVLGRADSVLGETQDSFKSVQDHLSSTVGGDDVLPVYEEFATDVIDDLRSVQEAGLRAVSEVTEVGARGKLYDLLAEGLYSREVASRFVVVVAQRLNAAE